LIDSGKPNPCYSERYCQRLAIGEVFLDALRRIGDPRVDDALRVG
jgi:hypothetical protein